MEVSILLKDYNTLIRRFALVTIGIILISFGISLFMKPDILEFINWADSKTSETNKTQIGKFFQYVVNNGIKVPFQMLILSLIPIPFVYYLPVALTAVATGVVLYLPFTPQLQDKMSFFKVFLGVFPHATIELFSFFIVLAVLFEFNKAIRSHLFKKSNSKFGVVYAFKKIVTVYCFVAFPLLVVAAFIEAFITPMIT